MNDTPPTGIDPAHHWPDLRRSVVVGTARRPLPGPLAPTTPETPAEVAALEAAAVLGAARRAGVVMRSAPHQLTGTGGAEASPDRPGPPERAEVAAPPAASQLLELLLAGNLGRPAAVGHLVEHWFEECVAHDRVISDRLLVAVLERATTHLPLQARVRPVLGRRGRWLGAKRPAWAWTLATDQPAPAPAAAPDDRDAPGPDLSLDELLAADRADRVVLLSALRQRDPAAARSLLDQARPHLDAASRADLFALLAHGLGPADEPLLDAALDDRSKAVRRVAVGLLDALPTSNRARRLGEVLTPLVERSGRLRTTITVRYPPPPDASQQRDLPPDESGAAVEAHWLRTLVAGVGLAWWEATLGLTPAQLVRAELDPADDLRKGWTRACLAQRDQAWARALLTIHPSPELLPVAGEPLTEVLHHCLAPDTSSLAAGRVLAAIPDPWGPAASDHIVTWARHHPKGASVLDQHADVLTRSLDPGVKPELEQWLTRGRKGDDDRRLEKALQYLIRQLSLREDISNAFTP